MNLLTCKLNEGRTRITKSEIQRRDRRAMTYGHVSSTGRGGNKHFSPIQAKHRNQVNNNHGDQGKSVESIMAMGLICIMFDYIKEAHAFCMKQNQPVTRAKDKDGIGANIYSHQESKTDKGARSSRRTDWLAVSKKT
eukprot:7378335-Heterocapsa_arctica.AAC.1